MGIIDNVKEIASIIQKADNIELYGKIIDLQGNILKIMEENSELKKEKDELLKLRDISDKMVFTDPYWYYDNEKIPSCPKCWDSDKILSHLVSIAGDSLHCSSCGLRYVIDGGEIVNIYMNYNK